jgi:hypothetical protein
VQDSTSTAKTMALFLYYNPPVTLEKLRSRQGKVAELRLELNGGGKKDKNFSMKKIALKRIVANMTMSNNDMVALFPDVIACMNLPSLEIKKMLVLGCETMYTSTNRGDRCFLYLVNYARVRPEIAVKAIPVLELVSLRVLHMATIRTDASASRIWKTVIHWCALSPCEPCLTYTCESLSKPLCRL